MSFDFRNEWLSELGQHLDIANPAFDANGYFRLPIDDELAVTVYKPDDIDELVLFGQVPIKCLSAKVMQEMLIENRHHGKHNTPVLSLSDNLNNLEIHVKLTQPEIEEAGDLMVQLIGHMHYWRANV